MWDFPEQIFLLVLICFSLEQYAEALIRLVHRGYFLGRLFLTSEAAAGLKNMCIKAIKHLKKHVKDITHQYCVCVCVCDRGFIIENKHILKLVTKQKLLILQITCPENFLTLLCYAKSLQSCPTLCNPIDGSPPGSPVPGILQARTLEWVVTWLRYS